MTPRSPSLSHTHLTSPGYPSDVRLSVAPTPTTILPKSVSSTRQAKLDNSFAGNNDHVYAEDEDVYILDGDHSPLQPRNDSSSQNDVTGNHLPERAEDSATTLRKKPTKSLDDEDPGSLDQHVSLPPAAVPIDATGNSSYNSDVSDDELSVEGPTAPDPTNEATGPEFSRPMPLWPFLAPLLLLLFLPPAVWCLCQSPRPVALRSLHCLEDWSTKATDELPELLHRNFRSVSDSLEIFNVYVILTAEAYLRTESMRMRSVR
ncbi:hypothetical protein MTO96_022528 [Rhipicephalus appendiculatus]